MSLNIVVTPGYTFPAGVPFSLAGLRRGAQPTVSISGAVNTADLVDGAVTAIKVTPDAFWYGLDTGAVNTAVVAYAPAIAQYIDGLVVAFKVANTNTLPVTLDAGAGPMAVVKNGNQPLDPGDWIAGQIVEVRYQLDVNILPVGAAYAAGSFTQAVTAGRQYTWTKGANDLSLTNGSTMLTTSGTFTAVGGTATLAGTGILTITATLVPVSNVWQMLSQLGNRNQYYPFRRATAYRSGSMGLVPGPKAGQQTFGLSGAGTWVDFVSLATAAAISSSTPAVNIFNWKNFK